MSEHPTLTMTRGLPASGKTTYALGRLAAAEPGQLVRLNRDELRRTLHGQAHYQPVTEQQVTIVQHGAVEALLRAKTDVVVDDTNLAARRLRALAEIAWKVGAEFVVEDFTDVPLAMCIERDAARAELARVGEAVIRSLHDRYLRGRTLPLPIPEKPEVAKGLPYVPDPALPKAIMVDIDGTVALHVTRSPYDTTRYHEDAPNQPVIDAVRAMHDARHHVVFCSGRDAEFRGVTETWLTRHVGIFPHSLHMRPEGDRRRDDEVKLELFDQHIRHRWNVVAAWDDRDRVVAAYRGIGLPVFQVNYGAF